MGPGKYNIKSQFDKTQIYYSGPLEKRFFENSKKINPGPGEYLQLVDWGKNINENQALKPNLYLNIKKNEDNSEKKVIEQVVFIHQEMNIHLVEKEKVQIISMNLIGQQMFG